MTHTDLDQPDDEQWDAETPDPASTSDDLYVLCGFGLFWMLVIGSCTFMGSVMVDEAVTLWGTIGIMIAVGVVHGMTTGSWKLAKGMGPAALSAVGLAALGVGICFAVCYFA